MSGNPQRVIAHVDLDCFYCQVEHQRLGIPSEVPLAVQQWDSLIAINYAARFHGIKRGMKADEAKRVCPEIRCVHVGTVGEEDGGRDSHDRMKSKASLDRYREASMLIMDVLMKFEAVVVERASIDEAYLDLTEAVRKRLGCVAGSEGGGGWGEESDESELDCENLSPEVKDQTLFVGVAQPRWLCSCLLEGVKIVTEIRAEVLRVTGYTLSAGLSENKLLSKVASAKNKPNRQTVVFPSGAESMIGEIDIKKIPRFGGKFGARVLAFLKRSWDEPVKTQVLQRASLERQAEMQKEFGRETAAWLVDICRGLDDSPVSANMEPKSIMAVKSFSKVTTVEAGRKWLKILAEDLHNRMKMDQKRWKRSARSLVLQCRTTTLIARTMRMPFRGEYPPTVESLVNAGVQLWERCGAEGKVAVPCTRLALGANTFAPLPEGKSIKDYCSAKVPSGGAKAEEEATSTKKSVDRSAPSTLSTLLDPLPTCHSTSPSCNEPEDPYIFTCPKCKKRMPRSLELEHLDFHYAKEVAGESQGGPVVSQNSLASAISSRQRQKRKAAGGTHKKNTLMKFFKKSNS